VRQGKGRASMANIVETAVSAGTFSILVAACAVYQALTWRAIQRRWLVPAWWAAQEDDTYECVECDEAEKPEHVTVKKGDTMPGCTSCGSSEAHWVKT
jgi:hypothetical protein